MKNLDKALNEMTLKNLTSSIKISSISNLIEPSEVLCKTVINYLVEGKTYKFIKKNAKDDNSKTLSFGQIKEIEDGKNKKYQELLLVANLIKEEIKEN